MINEIYTASRQAAVEAPSRGPLFNDLAVRIESLVRFNPDVRCEHGLGFIRVIPISGDGLPITLFVSGDRCSVALASWYDDFECVEVAMSFVEMAILGELRLKVETINGKAWSWTVERLMADGTWMEESVMAAPRLFSWGRKGVYHLRNDWASQPAMPRENELEAVPESFSAQRRTRVAELQRTC